MVRSKATRIDKEFETMLERIRAERIMNGIDHKAESPRRLSKAIARMFNQYPDMRNLLINSKLENDRMKKKGRNIKI